MKVMPDTRVSAISSMYRSAPVDASGDDFINAVVRLDTSLPAQSLLDHLQNIERVFGRERPFRNAPRTLDLDLLIYDQTTTNTPRLELPHPRMSDRAFVLLPLLEISPDVQIPGKGAARDYLAEVNHQEIERLDQPA
jgi:2-amino-4-hydroxy-6-hydroxymethyldihydropteridine diphosphokinase